MVKCSVSVRPAYKGVYFPRDSQILREKREKEWGIGGGVCEGIGEDVCESIAISVGVRASNW